MYLSDVRVLEKKLSQLCVIRWLLCMLHRHCVCILCRYIMDTLGVRYARRHNHSENRKGRGGHQCVQCVSLRTSQL